MAVINAGLEALVVIVVHSRGDLATRSAEIYSRLGLATVLSCTSSSEVDTAVTGNILRIPNVGYGSAVNAAVVHFRNIALDHPKWIVISNDDIEVSENAVDEVKRILRVIPPSVVAVGFDAARAWSPGSSGFSIKGSFFAVRWDEFFQCGGFDPRFFLYFEDTDLFERLSKVGRLALIPIPEIRHRGAGSTGKTFRAGFQITISAIEFRKANQASLRDFVEWLTLTVGSSLLSRQLAHSVGVVVGFFAARFPGLHNSLSKRWFNAATFDQRKEFRLE